MIFKIIMILGALFGFMYALRVKETYARVITWTMVVAIGMTFIQIEQLIIDGYYLFALTQLGVIVYGISFPDFAVLKKAVLISAGILSFLPVIILLGNLIDPVQNANSIAFIQITTAVLQLGIFGYQLKTDVKALKEEMGFLIILSADAIVRLLGGFFYFSVN